jgi:uncharacterized damage-inducible protein DinB
MGDVSQLFLEDSRAFLTREYMPKIEHYVSQLTTNQVWHHDNDASNSIGNLLLHLAGSSRWWAIEIIGGKPTGRVRQREFDQREPIPFASLLADLRTAVDEVDLQLADLTGEKLLEMRSVHDEQHSVLWCVYHIVEHFAYHTGQILSMAKAMAGELKPIED